MPLSIDLGSLTSRAVRSRVGNGGVRVFNPSGFQQDKDENGNILATLFSPIAKFVGFLARGLWTLITKFISFSWTAVWGWVTSAFQFIYTFNWNASDEELDKQVQAAWTQVAGSLGGTLGQAVGWLGCGVLPGTIMFTFNEPLGLWVLKNVGEEALDELAGNVAALTRLTFQAVTRSVFTFLFKKIRKTFFGTKQRSDKPWSIALKVEEAVEAIPNEALRAFVDNFLEESGEACIEAGYVVARSTDAYMAQQKLANQNLLGARRTVEITFDRDEDVQPPPTV